MTRRLLPTLFLGLLSLPALADEQWEITTSFEMTGMPMAMSMPPTTTKVCVPPGEQSREKLVTSGDKNCKVSNFRSTGNSSSFHIECGPPNNMSGDGQVTWSAGGYKGSLKAHTRMDGQNIDMKMTYTGRKTGACTGDSVNVRALQAQAQTAQTQQAAYTNQMCQQMVENLAYQGSEYMGQSCPNLKANICKSLSQRPEDPVGFLTLQQEGRLEGAAAWCGQDTAALQQRACVAAKAKKRWDAATSLCGEDPELAAVAQKECGGLNFTAMPSEDSRRAMLPLCSRYAPRKPAAAGNSAVDTGMKAVDTVNKLRGLFGR
jgi:hypothetical protein